MSDEEQLHSEDEGKHAMGPPEESGPTEAELAMQRRRAQQESAASAGVDDTEELLEANRQERSKMEDEIQELRERSERRKKEREEEERRMAEKRAEDEARRKAEEEERRRKKDEEEQKRREARAAKMAEFEKWSNPGQRNFVITKRAGGVGGGEGDAKDERKSREQLEAEKKAILGQRIQPLSTSGMDANKLAEKAKELHNQIYRLESERYDLEKRFKEQQYDMMELAERARQMIKVGKGGLKRVQLGQDDRDMIQENFAGAPSKIEMYSIYERQKDKRSYGERRTIFTGPQYGYPAERIAPQRIVGWNDVGQPIYMDVEGGEMPAPPAEEEVAEEE